MIISSKPTIKTVGDFFPGSQTRAIKKADLRGIGLSEEGDDTRYYPAPKSPLPSATANKGTLTPPFCIATMKQRCHFDTGGELFLCI